MRLSSPARSQLEANNPNYGVRRGRGPDRRLDLRLVHPAATSPTLDALNAAGLDVSAAGNHEFDAGYADLANRVMKPFDATSNPYGGAAWQYLAANVRKKSDNAYALPDVAASPGTSDGGTWTTTVGGVNVGFIGGVTEELPSLVSPTGIADLKVSSIINETNAAADALKARRRRSGRAARSRRRPDHLGGRRRPPTTTPSAESSTASTWTSTRSSPDTRTWHTTTSSTAVPVVSAGQYGTNLNRMLLTVDTDTDTVTFNTAPNTDISIVRANTVTVTDSDAVATKAAVQATVDSAVAQADVLGARVLGKVGGAFNRAKLADGTTENRGGESTLGNLVAEVHRWATSTPEAGAAQIAFMNPGGLRQDINGPADVATSRPPSSSRSPTRWST